LVRWTVVAPESSPLPRWATTASLSQGMSAAVVPGASATTLPVTALPSLASQLGPHNAGPW
jgi:hypothetical protein